MGNPQHVVSAKDSKSITTSKNTILNGGFAFCTFRVDGKIIGKLWAKDGILSFEGDTEESAKVFFDAVTKHSNSKLKQGAENGTDTDNTTNES